MSLDWNRPETTSAISFLAEAWELSGNIPGGLRRSANSEVIAGRFLKLITLLLTAMIVCLATTPAWAQNSSLLHAPLPSSNQRMMQAGRPYVGQPAAQVVPASANEPAGIPDAVGGVIDPSQQTRYPVATAGYDDRPPITLDGASWTYQPAPPMRVFKKNDLVTIRVDEITRVMAEGSAESRKRTLYEAILTDWVRLNDFRLRPDPQANGDPTVGTESNQNYRAQSSVASRESLAFNIAATVVDIRPNGTLVLEARKTIRVNDNLWETALSGTCRAQDIGPDNIVLSKDLIDLEINKEDQGHLRDGYKRGWFQRWFDRIQPF